MKRPFNILAAIGLSAPIQHFFSATDLVSTLAIIGLVLSHVAKKDDRHYIIGYWAYVLVSVYWLVDVGNNMSNIPWLVGLMCLMAAAALVTSIHFFTEYISRMSIYASSWNICNRLDWH